MVFRHPAVQAARCLLVGFGLLAFGFQPASAAGPKQDVGVPYLKLSRPRHVLAQAQAWEAKQFPHTMSVLERNEGGYRYWGWYGLNDGGGIGLARSNDLVNWTKYPQNPLLSSARWPSALDQVDPQHPKTVYLTYTRNYDMPDGYVANVSTAYITGTSQGYVVEMSSSYIVLGKTEDGIHIEQIKTLVPPVANERNQNPNLFRDPRSGRYYFTFYRGNDKDRFDIVSRSAATPEDLDKAPEKVLLHSTDTIAAPTLLYVPQAKAADGKPAGIYYLATEICPFRYTPALPDGDWQVKIFASDSPDGDFKPVAGNPIMSSQRACLFQHIFHGRFYGYDCHLTSVKDWTWILEEVEAPLP